MMRTGFIVMVVAATLVAGCGGGQGQAPAKNETPAATPAAGAATAQSGTGTKASVPAQLAALLPAKDEVPGWAPSSPPRGFSPDTLFELIDGAADGFITYGVRNVVAADYAQSGTKREIAVEIYEMKDPLNAFGKYAEERNPEASFVKVGNEGYTSGTTINFWTGPYYAKLTAFDEDPATGSELVKLASAIAAKVKTPGADPVEFSWFVADGQIARSAKYVPKDVLAQSYLVNGFEVQYKGSPRPIRVVLVGLPGGTEAADAFDRYKQVLGKGGSAVKEAGGVGEAGVSGRDGFYGNVVAARSGSRIAVALGVPNEDAGKRLLAGLLKNVK